MPKKITPSVYLPLYKYYIHIYIIRRIKYILGVFGFHALLVRSVSDLIDDSFKLFQKL